MTADAILRLVRLDHHGECVPSNEALDPSFDLAASREWWFFRDGNGVDVRCVCGERLPDAAALGMIGKLTSRRLTRAGPRTAGHNQATRAIPGFERFELGRVFRGSVPH
jgi:hypothetical protein